MQKDRERSFGAKLPVRRLCEYDSLINHVKQKDAEPKLRFSVEKTEGKISSTERADAKSSEENQVDKHCNV